MRRMVENRSGRRDFDTAKQLREKFTDRPSKKVIDLAWSWPRSMDEVGVCTAVMYSSDKWGKVGKFTDYKHVHETAAEKHRLLVSREFDLGLETFVEPYALDKMPDTVAELANILGLQYRLYDKDGTLGEQDYQVNIVRAKIGAAVHPNGETILLVYTATTLCCVITGFEVEKDGIVR
jgi:hypothetical protein